MFRLVSIEELAGIVMLCLDKTDTLTQDIMIIVSKLPCVRLQSKGRCRLHCWLRVDPERKGCH